MEEMNLKVTRTVQKDTTVNVQEVKVDICVVGAGISGVSAALEAARSGHKVALVDGSPTLGGQAVNSIIGTFAGLVSNGPNPYLMTYGIAEDIIRDLGAAGNLHLRRRFNTIMYDEVALARWIEKSVRDAGVTVITGAVLRGVTRKGTRIDSIDLATRYGDLRFMQTVS